MLIFVACNATIVLLGFMPMFDPGKLSVSLIVGAFVLLAGGMAVALDTGDGGPAIEQHVERACHRLVKSRSPHGHRDIRTFSYELEAPRVGVAKGSLRAQISSNHWSQVKWTCRVHPKSGRVLRVEFERSSGGSRLLAAASAL